jgi:hypothetical protein
LAQNDANLMEVETVSGVGQRAPDAGEYVFCALFTLIAVVSWSALTLAELRRFSAIALWLLSLSLLAAAAMLVRRLRPVGAAPGRVGLLWMLALGLVGTALLRPVDVLVEGADDNVYRHLGSLIGHRGGLTVEDPLLTATPPADWSRLLSRDEFWPHRLNRFEGGIQVADGDPRLEPNFFHLLPAWIAAVEVLGGPAAAPMAAPILALLAPMALFLAARTLFSTDAALAASALLVTNAAQTWAGRLPLSEVPVQFFVVSGVFFLAWWLSDRHVIPGVLAAVAFGLATLCRLDTLFLVIPFVAIVVALDWHRRGGSEWWVPALVLGLLMTHAILHAFTISEPYTLRLGRHLVRDESLAALKRLVAGINVALGLIVLWRLTGRTIPPRVVARTGQLIAAVVIGWLLLRIGPAIAGNHLILAITPLGAALAGAGVMRVAGSRDLRGWFVIGLLLASAIVYVESARDTPELPGVLRRDIPVLLPTTLLMLGAFLFSAGARPSRRLLGASVTVWLIVAGSRHVLVLTSEPSGRDMRGALDNLAGALPRESLVVIDSGLPSHLDLALDFTFDRTTLKGSETTQPTAIRAVIERALNAGRPVFLVTPDAAPQSRIDSTTIGDLAVEPRRTMVFGVERLRPTMGRWPEDVKRDVYQISLYQLRNIASVPWHVDVGGQDHGVLGSGWLARETLLDVSGRWTTGAPAKVAVPRIQCRAGQPMAMRVRLASLRPAGLAQPSVRVSLNDQDLPSLTPVDSLFRVYALGLPPAVARQVCAAPATMTLSAPSFIPRRDAGVGDDRQLGVAVDWIELTAADEPGRD